MRKEFGKTFIKRFLSSLLTLYLLVSFLFIIIRLSPGDPTNKYVSSQLSPDLAKKISASFKLNEPVSDQYVAFLVNVIQGDWGTSYNYHQPVLRVVWQYFSFTFVFALLSFIIQLIFSFYLTIFIVNKRNRLLDKIVSDMSLIVYSIPAFVLGVTLIYIFSVNIDLFPISGLRSLDFEGMSFTSKIFDQIHHIILPLITLSAAGIALFYRYLKDNIDVVLNQTYILHLKASGFRNKIIMTKHILPNAVRPLISVAGIELGILLGGALITEVIFGLPGMGRLTIDSILARDYPLVIGCVFTSGAVMIATNFIADLIKIKIDKRLTVELMN